MHPFTEKIVSGSYEDLLQQADKAYSNEDFTTAKELFNKIFQRLTKLNRATLTTHRPDLINVRLICLVRLATIAEQTGNYDEAIALYQQLITEDPANGYNFGQSGIATTELKRGNIQTGLDSLRMLVIQDPGDGILWTKLADALITYGDKSDLAEAETALKRALDRLSKDSKPYYDAQFLLMLVYQPLHRYQDMDKLLRLFEKQELIDNNNHIEYLYKICLTDQELDQAAHWLTKEKNPLKQLFYQGKLAEARGDHDRAETLWQTLISKTSISEAGDNVDLWLEAALRVNYNPQDLLHLLQTEELVLSEENINTDLNLAFLLGILYLKAEKPDTTHKIYQLRQQDFNQIYHTEEGRFTYQDWKLFQLLIPAAETQQSFAQYFYCEAPTE